MEAIVGIRADGSMIRLQLNKVEKFREKKNKVRNQKQNRRAKWMKMK